MLQPPVSSKSNFAGFQLDFRMQITDISAGDEEGFTEQPDAINDTSAHIFSQCSQHRLQATMILINRIDLGGHLHRVCALIYTHVL